MKSNDARRRRILRLHALLVLFLSSPLPILAQDLDIENVPIRYRIDPKQIECLYDKFVERDVVTFSVFVVEALNNGMPRASISFEGPVAGNTDVLPKKHSDGHEDDAGLHHEEANAPREAMTMLGMHTGMTIRRGLKSDWPRIRGTHSPMGVYQRNFVVDWTHAGESEDAAAARSAVSQRIHEEFRRHNLEHGHKEERERPPPPLYTVAKDAVTPYQETNEISLAGWYRLCVASQFPPLVVEMEMRTAERMRGIDPGTGHVYTHEARQRMDERAKYFDIINKGEGRVFDTENGHLQARDRDWAESKVKLSYLHELTSEIMKTQHQRMQRTRAHDADARRGAAALARSGRVETGLYVAIALGQAYTLRRWLLGNMPLGK